MSALLLATYPYHENLGKQLSIVAGKVNIDKKSLQKGNSSMASKPNNAMRISKQPCQNKKETVADFELYCSSKVKRRVLTI